MARDRKLIRQIQFCVCLFVGPRGLCTKWSQRPNLEIWGHYRLNVKCNYLQFGGEEGRGGARRGEARRREGGGKGRRGEERRGEERRGEERRGKGREGGTPIIHCLNKIILFGLRESYITNNFESIPHQDYCMPPNCTSSQFPILIINMG